MTDPAPRREPRQPLDGLGMALVAIGALTVTLCGGCTGFFWIAALWDMAFGSTSSRNSGLDVVFLVIPAVLGGVPTVGGALMLWIGWRRRTPRPPPSAPPPG